MNKWIWSLYTFICSFIQEIFEHLLRVRQCSRHCVYRGMGQNPCSHVTYNLTGRQINKWMDTVISRKDGYTPGTVAPVGGNWWKLVSFWIGRDGISPSPLREAFEQWLNDEGQGAMWPMARAFRAEGTWWVEVCKGRPAEPGKWRDWWVEDGGRWGSSRVGGTAASR